MNMHSFSPRVKQPHWILMLAVFLMSGCSNLQQLAKNQAKAQKPTATISSVSIKEANLSSITLNTQLTVTNPNPFSLKLAGLSLDTLIADHAIAKVQQPDAKLSLKASGDTQINLPVTLYFQEVYRAAKNSLGKNEVPYQIAGQLMVAIPILGNISVPLEHQGIFPIPKLPNIQISGIKLLEAGFSQARIQLDMNINNPNSFDLDLKQITFNLAAQGKSFSKGDIPSVELRSGQQQNVSLPISLSITELGYALFKLLQGNQAINFSLDGEAQVLPELSGWKANTMSFNSEKEISL